MHRFRRFCREKRAGFPSNPTGAREAATPPSPSSQIPPNDPVNCSSLAFHGSFSAPNSSHYGSELIPLRRFPFSSSSIKKQERSFLVPAPNGANPSPSIPWNVLPLKGSRTRRECGVFLLSSPIPSRHSKQREVPWNFCSLSSGKARLRLPPTFGCKNEGKKADFSFFFPPKFPNSGCFAAAVGATQPQLRAGNGHGEKGHGAVPTSQITALITGPAN